jgi:energy-converting hydrogenase B subunit D
MIPLQAAALALVALGALAVVLTRNIVRLAFVASLYGMTLVVLFLVYQAPDVALSQLVVGTVVLPLVIVVAIVKERSR